MTKNIKSKSMAFNDESKMDIFIMMHYNHPNLEVISHQISAHDKGVVVNIIYKRINDIDVG
jgi:hypothetical protein